MDDRIKYIYNKLDNINYILLPLLRKNFKTDDMYIKYLYSKKLIKNLDDIKKVNILTCWDIVNIEKELMKEQNIEYKCYFLSYDNYYKEFGHAVLLYKLNNFWFWFEYIFKDFRMNCIFKNNSYSLLLFIKKLLKKYKNNNFCSCYEYNSDGMYNIGSLIDYIPVQSDIFK